MIDTVVSNIYQHQPSQGRGAVLTHMPNTHAPQGGDGWNLLRVMDKVVFDAKARGDATCVSAATAVVARLKQVCRWGM